MSANNLLEEAWKAIEAYAEVTADGSIEDPIVKAHVEIIVNDCLEALRDYQTEHYRLIRRIRAAANA